MSDNINQSYNLDAQKTLAQLTALSKKINETGQQLARFNRLTLDAVKVNQTDEQARKASIDTFKKQALAMRQAADQLRTLSAKGQNLKKAFTLDLAAPGMGDTSHLQRYADLMARIGQVSGLTSAQIKGVFNEVNRLGDGANLASPKLQALFTSFKAINDEAVRVENYRNVIARMTELATVTTNTKTSQEQLTDRILRTKTALTALDSVQKSIHETLQKTGKLSMAEKEVRRDLITQTDKLRESLIYLTKEQQTYQKDVKAGVADINAKKIALVALTKAIQDNILAEKQRLDAQRAGSKQIEQLLRQNFKMFDKPDTRTRVELDLIVQSLVALKETSELTGKQFDKMMLQVANNTGRPAPEFAGLAKQMMGLTDRFKSFAHTLKNSRELTFGIGQAVKSEFIDKFALASGASDTLRTKFMSLADQMGQLAQKSGLQAKELTALMEAISSGDYRSKVVKDNIEVAQSFQKIFDQVDALNRLQGEMASKQAMGQGGVDFFRQKMPGPTSNLTFIKETDQVERSLRKIGETANVTKTQLERMISDAVVGKQRDYVHAMLLQQKEMQKANQLSFERAAAMRKEAEHQQRVSGEVFRAVAHYKELIRAKKLWAAEAIKSIHSVNVSWRSYIRYFLTRTLYRAFMQLVSGMREGIRASFELQQRIAEIRTITQNSIKPIQEWANELKSLSNVFPQSTLDIAEGAYLALSNQVANASNVTAFLTQTLRLAITTMSTTAESVNAVSSVIKSYNMDASKAGEVSAQLFKIVELGRLRLSDIANEMGNVTVVAAQLGIPFEEVGAALTTLTRQGVTPANAMTLLRNVLMKLIGPTENMKDLFQEWGVNSAEAAVETFGFFGVLQKLSVATKGDLTEISELFSRIRATTGFAGLTGGENLKQYEQDMRAIASSLDSYNEATARAFDNTAMRLRIEMQELSNYFSVDIGTAFISLLDKVNTSIGGLTPLVKTLTGNLLTVADGFGKALGFLAKFPKTINFTIAMYVQLIIQLKALVVYQRLVNSKFIASLKIKQSLIKLGNLLIGSNALIAASHLKLAGAVTTAKAIMGGWGRALIMAGAAIGTYIYTNNRMRTEAFERSKKAVEDSVNAWKASERVLNDRISVLSRVKAAELGLAATIQRQRQQMTDSRAANFKTLNETKDIVKEVTASWEENFKALEKATDTEKLKAFETAARSALDQIKSINDQLFERQFQEPVTGFENLDAQLENLQTKANAYASRAADAYAKAFKSSGDELNSSLQDARNNFATSMQAIQQAEQSASSQLQQNSARRLEIEKELTSLGSVRRGTLTEIRQKEEQARKLQEELRNITASEAGLLRQSTGFRAQMEEALKRQLSLEKQISLEMEARAQAEKERIADQEARNEKAGKLFTSLTSLDFADTAGSAASINAARDQMVEVVRDLAKQGAEGLQMADILMRTLEQSNKALAASQSNKVADAWAAANEGIGTTMQEGLDNYSASTTTAMETLNASATRMAEELKLLAAVVEQSPKNVLKDTEGAARFIQPRVVDLDYQRKRKELIAEAARLEGLLNQFRTKSGQLEGSIDNEKYVQTLEELRSVITRLAEFSAERGFGDHVDAYTAATEQLTKAMEASKEAGNTLASHLNTQDDVLQRLNSSALTLKELNDIYRELTGSDALSIKGLLTEIGEANPALANMINVTIQENAPNAIQAGFIAPMVEFNRVLEVTGTNVTSIIEKLDTAIDRQARLNFMRGAQEGVEAFSRGGWVGGSGSRDTIPAMLTPGEFVVNKQAAMSFAPVLEAINSNKRGGNTTTSNSTSYGDVVVNIYGNESRDVSPDTARQVADLIYREQSRRRVR